MLHLLFILPLLSRSFGGSNELRRNKHVAYLSQEVQSAISRRPQPDWLPVLLWQKQVHPHTCQLELNNL